MNDLRDALLTQIAHGWLHFCEQQANVARSGFLSLTEATEALHGKDTVDRWRDQRLEDQRFWLNQRSLVEPMQEALLDLREAAPAWPDPRDLVAEVAP